MAEKPQATTRRRNYEKDAETRELLIDTAVAILRTEGVGAVSARKVSAQAGLSHQIVHYYFRSMEELLLEVIHRASIKHLKALENAKNAEQPLWTAWMLISNKESGRLEMEYLAIANRYASAQQMLRELRGQYRQQLIALISVEFKRHDIKLDPVTPAIAAATAHAVARSMALESTHGSTEGHEEMQALIESYLEKYEGPRPT